MFGINVDAMDCKILTDEFGDSLIFEQYDEFTIIAPDSGKKKERDMLERVDWSLRIDSEELIAYLRELADMLEKDLFQKGRIK